MIIKSISRIYSQWLFVPFIMLARKKRENKIQETGKLQHAQVMQL